MPAGTSRPIRRSSSRLAPLVPAACSPPPARALSMSAARRLAASSRSPASASTMSRSGRIWWRQPRPIKSMASSITNSARHWSCTLRAATRIQRRSCITRRRSTSPSRSQRRSCPPTSIRPVTSPAPRRGCLTTGSCRSTTPVLLPMRRRTPRSFQLARPASSSPSASGGPISLAATRSSGLTRWNRPTRPVTRRNIAFPQA